MTRQNILDLYFMDARSKLIDIAAFLESLSGEVPANYAPPGQRPEL